MEIVAEIGLPCPKSSTAEAKVNFARSELPFGLNITGVSLDYLLS